VRCVGQPSRPLEIHFHSQSASRGTPHAAAPRPSPGLCFHAPPPAVTRAVLSCCDRRNRRRPARLDKHTRLLPATPLATRRRPPEPAPALCCPAPPASPRPAPFQVLRGAAPAHTPPAAQPATCSALPGPQPQPQGGPSPLPRVPVPPLNNSSQLINQAPVNCSASARTRPSSPPPPRSSPVHPHPSTQRPPLNLRPHDTCFSSQSAIEATTRGVAGSCCRSWYAPGTSKNVLSCA
jgi:hypothetical protein